MVQRPSKALIAFRNKWRDPKASVECRGGSARISPSGTKPTSRSEPKRLDVEPVALVLRHWRRRQLHMPMTQTAMCQRCESFQKKVLTRDDERSNTVS
jgi:hypothetical protein